MARYTLHDRKVIVHEYEVTEASGHYKQVEDFVTSKIFMAVVEDWKLKCIYYTTYGIYDTACQ